MGYQRKTYTIRVHEEYIKLINDLAKIREEKPYTLARNIFEDAVLKEYHSKSSEIHLFENITKKTIESFQLELLVKIKSLFNEIHKDNNRAGANINQIVKSYHVHERLTTEEINLLKVCVDVIRENQKVLHKAVMKYVGSTNTRK